MPGHREKFAKAEAYYQRAQRGGKKMGGYLQKALDYYNAVGGAAVGAKCGILTTGKPCHRSVVYDDNTDTYNIIHSGNTAPSQIDWTYRCKPDETKRSTIKNQNDKKGIVTGHCLKLPDITSSYAHTAWDNYINLDKRNNLCLNEKVCDKRYPLGKSLDISGAFGALYAVKGRDDVVIKYIKCNSSDDKDNFEFTYDNETNFLEKVKIDQSASKNIIDAYGYYKQAENQEHQEHPNIFANIYLERCNGGELFTFIQKFKRLTENQTRYITSTVCEAIKYMHDKGYAHLDLKPQNILLKEQYPTSKPPNEREWFNQNIRIIDFGFTMEESEIGADYLGTPDYMSPELLLTGERVGTTYKRTLCDIWAIGIIVYIMHVGAPFLINGEVKLSSTGDHIYILKDYLNASEVYNSILKVLITYAVNDFSPEMYGFIQHCLQPPQNRPDITTLLTHPWLTTEDSPTTGGGTPSATERARVYRIRKFVARERVRKIRDQLANL